MAENLCYVFFKNRWILPAKMQDRIGRGLAEDQFGVGFHGLRGVLFFWLLKLIWKLQIHIIKASSKASHKNFPCQISKQKYTPPPLRLSVLPTRPPAVWRAFLTFSGSLKSTKSNSMFSGVKNSRQDLQAMGSHHRMGKEGEDPFRWLYQSHMS